MDLYRTFYEPFRVAASSISYHGTLADAHAAAKAFPVNDWSDVYVELIENVSPEHARVLNSLPIAFLCFKATRTWQMWPNGDLIEMAAGLYRA